MLFLHAGVILLLRLCSGKDTDGNSPDINPPEEEIDYTNKIESGIVFKDRGKVLITGESWTVAKEFNITEVSLLVEEAKNLFPDIRRKLEDDLHGGGGGTWDLDFFRTAIIQEIEVVEPIINKIEDKIRIFENMLPKKVEDFTKESDRKKRALGAFLIQGLLRGVGSAVGGHLVKWLFGWNDDWELRALNEKYEKMRHFQFIMANQLDFHEMILSDLDERVNETADDIRRMEAALDKHFTIISDLEVKTSENRQSIKMISAVIEKALSEWRNSRKELTQKLNLVVNITSIMRMMEIRLLNIDTQLTGLLDALDTAATGRLSPSLISPIQLVDILRNISRKLPEGVYPLTLIEEDAVYEYYTYASVQALAIPSAIRIFVKLPLKSPNRLFHLFEPYSLPFYHETAGVFLEIAKPSEYVLASRDLQKVAEITGKILDECKKKEDFYLCPATFPLYEGTKCSLSLIKGDEDGIIKSCQRKVVVPDFQSRWIRTDGGWIYSVPRTTRLMRIRENEPPDMVRVSGTGLIEDIPNAYTYSGDGTVLFPNDNLGDKSANSSIQDVYVPTVPNLLLLDESSRIQREHLLEIIGNLSKSNFDMEIVNLEHLLNSVKAQALKTERKDMTGYTLLPVLAIAIIVNYAVLGFLCWSRTKKNVFSSKKDSSELEEICD